MQECGRAVGRLARRHLFKAAVIDAYLVHSYCSFSRSSISSISHWRLCVWSTSKLSVRYSAMPDEKMISEASAPVMPRLCLNCSMQKVRKYDLSISCLLMYVLARIMRNLRANIIKVFRIRAKSAGLLR